MKLLNLIIFVVILTIVGFLLYKYSYIDKLQVAEPHSNNEANVSDSGYAGLTVLKSYDPPVKKSEEEWRKILSPEQYSILREAGTEAPFTGELLNNKEEGVYVTADCEEEVFSSNAKFDSKTGWPSFYEAINPDAIVLVEDNSYGLQRIEVIGKKCGGHLGHLFNDGPDPTGLRFCINSLALKFIPNK